MMKKILILILGGFVFLNTFIYAESSWTLVPESSTDVSSKVEEVGSEAGKVWEKYNEKAKEIEKDDDVGAAFASGIFNWNIIFSYLKYLAKLLSQIGLVIGALMFIYAGYKYAVGVFTGDVSKGGKETIKSAIYGLLIIIFSYAIMRLLLAMFW